MLEANGVLCHGSRSLSRKIQSEIREDEKDIGSNTTPPYNTHICNAYKYNIFTFKHIIICTYINIEYMCEFTVYRRVHFRVVCVCIV